MGSQECRLVVRGQLLTPMITKKIKFTLLGCKATIINPRRRYYLKINASKPMYPYSYISYLGKIEIKVKSSSLTVLNQKCKLLLQKTHIGRYQSEGLGEIKWKGGYIDNYVTKSEKHVKERKLRIRKGLPLKLTLEQQKLLKYALLHDFFHTPRHQSKIYQEPQIKDQQLVEKIKKHHEKTTNPMIKQFQYYDRLAASITRKIRSPIISRYNWQAKKSRRRINFTKLAKEIQEVAETNIWNLYRYMYESKELRLVNESMTYGHTTLRNHLLVIANLIVQDFGNESRQKNKHKKSR